MLMSATSFYRHKEMLLVVIFEERHGNGAAFIFTLSLTYLFPLQKSYAYWGPGTKKTHMVSS